MKFNEYILQDSALAEFVRLVIELKGYGTEVRTLTDIIEGLIVTGKHDLT